MSQQRVTQHSHMRIPLHRMSVLQPAEANCSGPAYQVASCGSCGISRTGNLRSEASQARTGPAPVHRSGPEASADETARPGFNGIFFHSPSEQPDPSSLSKVVCAICTGTLLVNIAAFLFAMKSCENWAKSSKQSN